MAGPTFWVHTADNQVPPLDDELAGLLDDTVGIHPGIDLIRDGIRLLALDRHTVGKTQTIVAGLAGADANMLLAIGHLIARLSNPVTNPALRGLADDRQKNTQYQGEMTAYLLTDPKLTDQAAEIPAAIDGT